VSFFEALRSALGSANLQNHWISKESG
jgi:hypothetical protein